VHLFCYYCAAQFEDEEEMERQCGVKHLRGAKQPDAKLTEQTSKGLFIPPLTPTHLHSSPSPPTIHHHPHHQQQIHTNTLSPFYL